MNIVHTAFEYGDEAMQNYRKVSIFMENARKVVESVLGERNGLHGIKGARPLSFYSRAQIEAYMVDCHAFDKEEMADWESKADLIADIRAFGWEADAIAYLNW